MEEKITQLEGMINHLSTILLDMITFNNALIRKGIINNEELAEEQKRMQKLIKTRHAKASQRNDENRNIQPSYPRADASDCKRS